MIRVLDTPVALWITQLLVCAEPVELQYPMLEPARDVKLTRADLLGLGIPGDDGLRPCAARRRPHANDLHEGGARVTIRTYASTHSQAGTFHLARKLDRSGAHFAGTTCWL